MTDAGGVAVHATAVVVGEAGILIRGPAGAGKSRLALLLLDEARWRGRFARLVGDDRVLLRRHGGGLVAAAHPVTAGLIERRTQGFARLPHAPRCRLRLAVDLYPAAAPLPRYPDQDGAATDPDSGLPLLRLQGPPDALSCAFVLDALAAALNTVDGP